MSGIGNSRMHALLYSQSTDYKRDNNVNLGKKWPLGAKIQAIWNTFLLKFTSKLPGRIDPVFNRVAAPGSQLNTGIVNTLLANLQRDKFSIINTFVPIAGSINNSSWDEIKSTIDCQKNTSKGKTVLVPVVVSGQGRFEKQHIVLIAFNSEKIEFYDPKGIHANHYHIGQNKTIIDLINHIKDKYEIKGDLIQNSYRHQKDINNCGVFVCERARQLQENPENIGSFEDKKYSFKDLREYRQKILNKIS